MNGSLKFVPAVTGLECVHQGKVRDTFAIPDFPDLLLIVATDRVSTHNVVHGSVIPRKGEALTALTVFWMAEQLKGIRTHLIAWGRDIYGYLPAVAGGYPADLHLRAIVVEKLEMFPVEFIFRSRMAGSLWKEYYKKGLPNPYGLTLTAGLQLMSPFEETIFTPTDKSDVDDPLKAAEVIARYPEACAVAQEVYERGKNFAATKGIAIIDGKFEVGLTGDGRVCLADECLTPDACRFVWADAVTVGQEPTWLDKQHLREEAERLWNGGKKVPLAFGTRVCAETSLRYSEIVGALTGRLLKEYQSTMFS